MHGLFTAWWIPGAARPHAQIRQPGAGTERRPAVVRPQLLLWSDAWDGESQGGGVAIPNRPYALGSASAGTSSPCPLMSQLESTEGSTKPRGLRAQDCGISAREFQDWQDPHPQGIAAFSQPLLMSPKYQVPRHRTPVCRETHCD